MFVISRVSINCFKPCSDVTEGAIKIVMCVEKFQGGYMIMIRMMCMFQRDGTPAV